MIRGNVTAMPAAPTAFTPLGTIVVFNKLLTLGNGKFIAPERYCAIYRTYRPSSAVNTEANQHCERFTRHLELNRATHAFSYIYPNILNFSLI